MPTFPADAVHLISAIAFSDLVCSRGLGSRVSLRHKLSLRHEPEARLEAVWTMMPLPDVVGPFTDLRIGYGEIIWPVVPGILAHAPALPALVDAASIMASLPTSPPA